MTLNESDRTLQSTPEVSRGRDTTPEINHPEILLAFYGDDFTGSTDSMEALTLNGLDTVLFLQPPDEALLRRFPTLRCYGIAGVSRSMDPHEMERELTPVFEKMKPISSRIVHYKTCSTFDSSPQTGSIGLAIDLGRKVFGCTSAVPLLVGAPVLGRYTLFGNHFARVKGVTFRLDRHPTMANHPVTPMHEADLRRHLSEQTDAQIGLMDVFDLDGSLNEVEHRYEDRVQAGNSVVLFDVLDEQRLAVAGGVIWNQSEQGQRFVAGSSGVEYALTAWWKENGVIEHGHPKLESPGPVDQIAVFSGSCSPVTQSQIQWAADNGFQALRVPVEWIAGESQREQVHQAVLEQAKAILDCGQSVILYTALGPDDRSILQVQQALSSQGQLASKTGEIIGKALGHLARALVQSTGLRRIVMAGGDTSSYASRQLGIYGLRMHSPIAPGSPLCVAYSENPRLDGLQIALKGGQVGKEDYFTRVLCGTSSGL